MHISIPAAAFQGQWYVEAATWLRRLCRSIVWSSDGKARKQHCHTGVAAGAAAAAATTHAWNFIKYIFFIKLLAFAKYLELVDAL